MLFSIVLPELAGQTVKDVQGNIYKTVTIGEQTWMAENLKTSKYNDGSAIPLVSKNRIWSILRSPGFCWYDKDIINKNIHGALYNWYTVITGKLCPVGWHVPTDAEWTTLINFLGGMGVAGTKLKESSNTNTAQSSSEPTNESGFTALPGGFRFDDGLYSSSGKTGDWWTSTENDKDRIAAFTYTVGYFSGNVSRILCSKKCGFSVRCIQDKKKTR